MSCSSSIKHISLPAAGGKSIRSNGKTDVSSNTISDNYIHKNYVQVNITKNIVAKLLNTGSPE